jgi:hypothetical protein
MARQRKPGSTAPFTAPVWLTRQADEQALRDIERDIDRWLFSYVQRWRCVDPNSLVGVALDPMKDEEVRAFVAAHYRELWEHVPERLKQEYAEARRRLDKGTDPAAAEKWLPATEAVHRAEQCGHNISTKVLIKDTPKHGVRVRPRQLPGNHKQEVEWNSLAGYLLERARATEEPDEEETSARLREAAEVKRKERPLD